MFILLYHILHICVYFFSIAPIRILLHGYEPKEKPDARFYEAMRQLSAIGNNINQIAHWTNGKGYATQAEIHEAVSLVKQAYRRILARSDGL